MVSAQAGNAFHPDSLNNSALMAARQRMVQAYGPQTYAAHVRATAARPDRSHLLNGDRPTLVLAASHDRVFAPETLQAYARHLPGARVETVAHAGHLAPMEQPAAVAAALQAWVEGSA